MSTMNELDITIQEYSKSPEEYQSLKKEINEHIHGKDFDTLSPKAQCIMMEWEEMARME